MRNPTQVLEAFSQQVGDTPMHRITNGSASGTIWAKCEWHNPTGSVKDRAAVAMVSEVLRQHDDLASLHILEYSGGNLGLSLATICHMMGVKLTLVLSASSPLSLLNKLHALGAQVELVDVSEGFGGVIQHAITMAKDNSDYTFLYQHRNPANVRAHTDGTGAEILKQMSGRRIDAWIAAAGSGGTLAGVYDALSRVFPDVALHMVMPTEMPYGTPVPANPKKRFAGSGGLGKGIKQHFLEVREPHITSEWNFSYEETLHTMQIFLEETGIRIGTSAAANLLAAQKVATQLGPQANVVTIFPDRGSPEEWADANALTLDDVRPVIREI